MHPRGMKAGPLNLPSMFFMLSAFDSNEPGRYDWLFSGWLKVVPPNTWIYFDISYAGNLIASSAVVSVIIIFISASWHSCWFISNDNVKTMWQCEMGNLQKIGTSDFSPWVRRALKRTCYAHLQLLIFLFLDSSRVTLNDSQFNSSLFILHWASVQPLSSSTVWNELF